MPRSIGPGCSTTAWPGSSAWPLLGQPVAHRVLARRREEAAVHPLGLHPQHQHRVGDGQFGVEVVDTVTGQPSTPTGSSVGGATSTTSAPRVCQQQHVGAGHPAVQDVADDHHPLALDAAEPLPDGQRVEQRLGGVFVGAVAGVDHRRAAVLGRRVHSASCCAAPEAGCRMISASAPAARSVSAVSRSDSPLATDDPDALTLITSALIHLPATSNDTRVRVEFS